MAEDLDGFFVTNLKNVYYLSGFTGSAGALVVTRDKQYFITDFRYQSQAHEQVTGFEIIIHQQGIFAEVARIIQEETLRNLAIEAEDMNVSTYLTVKDTFDCQIKETQMVIETIRSVKDQSEIDRLKEACEIIPPGRKTGKYLR